MTTQRKLPFKTPATDEERRQVFEEMLRRSNVSLHFEPCAPEAPSAASEASSGVSFVEMVRDAEGTLPVSMTLAVSFKGGTNERAFFRNEIDRLLPHRGQSKKEEKGRSTSAITTTHPEDAGAVLQCYADIAARIPDEKPAPAIKTYISPALCERVVTGYRGDTKPSVGEALAGFLGNGKFRDPKILDLMESERSDPASAGNVSALQYYGRHGKNPKEVKHSPAY